MRHHSLWHAVVNGLVLATVFTAGAYLGPRLVMPAQANQALNDVNAATLFAQRIVLTDANGKGRVIMAVVDDKPVFQMQDLRDKARLTMGLTETGDPTLFMGDNEGRPRLNVSVSGPSGLPGLTLLDDQKKPRVMLSMLPAGYPAMDFIDQAGKARIRLMTGDAKTGSYLVCQDQRGQPRASVGCIGDEFNGMGGFCIFTAAGQVVKAISE